MTEEIWKDVVNYEGVYQISNIGNLKSLDRKLGGTRYKGKEKRKHLSGRGYLYSKLSIGGVQKSLFIHKLVAEAFLENTENKPHVNHIDGNKINNKVENLEWCTHAENMRHAMRTGLNDGHSKFKEGNTNSNSKVTSEQVIEIRRLKTETKLSNYVIGNMFNIYESAVRKIATRQNWKHI